MKVNVRLGNPYLKTEGAKDKAARQRASAVFSRVVRALAESVVLSNIYYLQERTRRKKRTPSLYTSGVKYENEEPGRPDEAVDIPILLSRGHGDCLHLCCWRVAELRERGERAKVRMTWQQLSKRKRLFHVTVRRGDGSIECPSKILGM